jgi:hypothetical protein
MKEMEQSWRMQGLVDDLMYGLKKGVHFTPHYLA